MNFNLLELSGREEAVAFDLDGLMFNTEPIHSRCANILLGRRGHSFTPELQELATGRSPRSNLQLFIDYFRLDTDVETLLVETIETTIGLLQDGYETTPGLLRLLDALDARRVPRCVCTSGITAIATEILRKDGVGARMDFILTSDDVTNGKPSPEIYLKASERFGIAPSRMLVLEDSAAGSQAASSAGSPCCMYKGPHNQSGDFSRALTVVERLDAPEILGLLAGRGAVTEN